MKNNFLSRSTIKGTILAMAMLTVSQTTFGAPPPGNDSGTANKTAIHAELTSKYGLTQQQLAQYDKLLDERDLARKAVNDDSALSKKERSERLHAIGDDFRKKMSSVMGKNQYDKWLKDLKAEKEQNEKNKKELDAAISKIRKSNLPHLQKQEQIAAAEAEYVRKTAIVAGNQQSAELKLEMQHTSDKMGQQGKKQVKLSFEQTKQLKALTDEKNRKMAELKAKKLIKRLQDAESDKIMEEYNDAVRNLLGDQKYAQWNKNRNTQTDRNLQKRYGMTPDQIAKYKALQNARTVEKYKASKSIIPKDEQIAKRKEIDAKYDAKVKEILTAEQSRKLFAQKAVNKQKSAKEKSAKEKTNTQKNKSNK